MADQYKIGLDFLQYDRTLGVHAMEGRGFYYPVDSAIGPDGRIYGLNRGHDGDNRGVRVCILDLDSSFFGSFGSWGEGAGQFIWPAAIAIDGDNKVYVADEYLDRISVFDAEGNFLAKWGCTGSGQGQIRRPCGLSFDANNDLCVSDHHNNRVQKFTSDGDYLFGFGSAGSQEGQLNLPWGLTVAPSGDIYVADWRNDRIQRFTAGGEFVAGYGTPGEGEGELNRPASIAVDGEGYMFVANWGNERVEVFDPDGQFVTNLRGDATVSPWAQEFLDANMDEAKLRANSDLLGAVNIRGNSEHEASSHIEHLFWSPISVKLDGIDRLFVTERNRHRIQIYRKSS